MQSARKLWMGSLALLLISSVAFARPDSDPTPESAKWLVEGAEVVLALNIKQVFSSDLMKKGGAEALKGLIAGNEHAKTVLEATGIDPTKDIDSITLSGTMSTPKDVKALVVVRGKFNLDKIQTAAEKFAKKNPEELKLVKDDKLQLYKVKTNDQHLFGAFVDSTTLVFTPSQESTVEAVKTAGRKAGKVSKILEPALEKFSGKESLALALVVNDELKKALEKAPQAKEIAPKLQSLTATLTLTDAATTDLTINTDDAMTAKKVLMLLNQAKALGQLVAGSDENFGPIATELLNALKMGTEKGSVNVNLKVTPEMIEKATKDKDKEKEKDKEKDKDK